MRGQKSRTLVLGVENLCGAPTYRAADVAALVRSVRATADFAEDAHIVVGASCGTGMVEAGLGSPPGARRVLARWPQRCGHRPYRCGHQ